MGKVRFTEEFKREAVAQIVERGYSATEVSARLGSANTRSTRGRRNFRALRDRLRIIAMSRSGS